MKTAVYRKEHFNATHRLHNPNWSEEKNEKIFGLCNNPNFHGHNYDIVLKVVGEINPETGYVVDAKILKDLIKKHASEKYDHKNLYIDVDDFHNLNPTAENIAKIIFENIREEINSSLQVQIRLYETERNFVEYPSSPS